MASKRAAKKAVPPPPPPPPAESSDDETRSGSRSRSDESDDEEVIADSPVPAATPALKNAPATSQKGGESESSEEESDEDEEEEEEEPARAAPKNQPPPPQKKQDSEASGSDEEEEEEEEEEPAPKKQPPLALKKQPPPALKKQPPLAPKKSEESDASDEEEEEEEEVPPPPPKPAPKKDLKPPAAAAETKKPGERIWSTNDEARILEALAAHQKQHGTLPQPDALVELLSGKLDNTAYGSKELHSKVKSLRTRYVTLSKRGEPPSKEHDRLILDLCKIVWGGSNKTSPAAAVAVAANGHECKGFEEMCELYPYLAEEVKELEAARPGMCKREFGKIDDDKARSMDEKIKRQRVAQIRLEMRRSDLTKEVTKALVDLVDA